MYIAGRFRGEGSNAPRYRREVAWLLCCGGGGRFVIAQYRFGRGDNYQIGSLAAQFRQIAKMHGDHLRRTAFQTIGGQHRHHPFGARIGVQPKRRLEGRSGFCRAACENQQTGAGRLVTGIVGVGSSAFFDGTLRPLEVASELKERLENLPFLC